MTIELKAALNQDWDKTDKGWVEILNGKVPLTKLEVTETGSNTGLFTAKYKIPATKSGDKMEASYGYFGLGTKVYLNINF